MYDDALLARQLGGVGDARALARVQVDVVANAGGGALDVGGARHERGVFQHAAHLDLGQRVGRPRAGGEVVSVDLIDAAATRL